MSDKPSAFFPSDVCASICESVELGTMFPLITVKSLGAVTLVIGVGILGLVAYDAFFESPGFSIGQLRGVFWSLIFILFGRSWLQHTGKGIEDVKSLDLNAPEMVRATQLARESLPEFIAAVEQGLATNLVRCQPGEFGESKLTWAYVHFHSDGRFNVTPVESIFDDEITIPDEERCYAPADHVVDWIIREPDGKTRGGFSLLGELALRERLGKTLTPAMKRQREWLSKTNPV